MSCHSVVVLLEPFVDGELTPEKVLEVEQHLEGCTNCVQRVRLGEALRGSMKRVVRPAAEPSDAFRARLASAIEAAQQREWEGRVLERQIEQSRMLSWRTILPVAAAAAMTLVWAASANDDKYANRVQSQYARVDNVDDLLEGFVQNHVNTPPEVMSSTLLPEYEAQVGVPMRVPSLKQYGANWEGVSVVPIRNQRAASLRYKLGSHKVTLYMYDSSRFPIEKRLQRRQVGETPVYVGSRRGYSIGATDSRGVGYALASDLNDAETAELVAALY
ncbi:MAG TPA: zf-HC2 domain-containing protein [Polyangiaceae bacterium]|nr:zf-HC2 domain-containing protein [Polyangiaceae bacterium]